MKVELTRRIHNIPGDMARLTSENIRYELNPLTETTRIIEEIFDFSNVESMWLSSAQGEAVLEMAKPFDEYEKNIFIPLIADEEEIWISSDGTLLHIVVDAFEYFEVL